MPIDGACCRRAWRPSRTEPSRVSCRSEALAACTARRKRRGSSAWAWARGPLPRWFWVSPGLAVGGACGVAAGRGARRRCTPPVFARRDALVSGGIFLLRRPAGRRASERERGFCLVVCRGFSAAPLVVCVGAFLLPFHCSSVVCAAARPARAATLGALSTHYIYRRIQRVRSGVVFFPISEVYRRYSSHRVQRRSVTTHECSSLCRASRSTHGMRDMIHQCLLPKGGRCVNSTFDNKANQQNK